MSAILIIGSVSCGNRAAVTNGNDTGVVVWEESGSFGDSKLALLDDQVVCIATLGGRLRFRIDDRPFLEFTPTVPANWVSLTETDDGSLLLVVGDGDEKTITVHEAMIDSGRTQLLSTISSDGFLKIDPAIIQIGTSFYATCTQIDGVPNNGDASVENGHYSIMLYRSDDLYDWIHVTTLLSTGQNIEDGRLIYDEEQSELYYLFEREILDKQPSSIELIVSHDHGLTWELPLILLDPSADQEPAALVLEDQIYTLFYSSDIDNDGSGSYAQARMKRARLNQNFELMEKDITIGPFTSLILLDVMHSQEARYYLFLKDYSSNRKLVLYRVPTAAH